MTVLTTSLLVAAAVAFCAGEPAEPRCTDAPVEAVDGFNEAQRATMHTIAGRFRFDIPGRSRRVGATYRDEGRTDRWASGGDCEDLSLAAAAELRARHPELSNAYRFVLVHEGWAMAGARRVRLTHLVLVIESEAERVVIDTRYAAPRSWSAYAGGSAFTPRVSLSGDWMPYR